MNSKIYGIGLFLASLLFLAGCKGVDDITMTGVSGFELKSLENNTLAFTALVGVSNPSSTSFRVSEVNLKTLVDGNFLGTLTTNDRVRIPARSDSSYRMSFTLRLANLFTGAASLYGISQKSQVNIELQGHIRARSWLMTRKTEIRETRTVDVPSFNQ